MQEAYPNRIVINNTDYDDLTTVDAKLVRLAQEIHGTLLTNDFRGLVPGHGLDPFSLVCKVISANGRPAVKISDNPTKAVGPPDEIARYKRIFEVGEQAREDVLV